MVAGAKGHGKRRCIASACVRVNALFLAIRRQAVSYFAALGARDDYLLRQITSVGVEGSEALSCGVVEGKVNSFDNAVFASRLEFPFDASSLAASTIDALHAFFLAITCPRMSDCEVQKWECFSGKACGSRTELRSQRLSTISKINARRAVFDETPEDRPFLGCYDLCDEDNARFSALPVSAARTAMQCYLSAFRSHLNKGTNIPTSLPLMARLDIVVFVSVLSPPDRKDQDSKLQGARIPSEVRPRGSISYP